MTSKVCSQRISKHVLLREGDLVLLVLDPSICGLPHQDPIGSLITCRLPDYDASREEKLIPGRLESEECDIIRRARWMYTPFFGINWRKEISPLPLRLVSVYTDLLLLTKAAFGWTFFNVGMRQHQPKIC
jgi:hypothetical protein